MNALIVKPINHLYKIFKVYFTIGTLGALAVIVVEFVIAKPLAFLIFFIAVSFLLIGIMLWAQARKLEQGDRSANQPANPEALVLAEPNRGANQSANPVAWFDEHGAYLFKYALFRLRDHEAAEDVVQETLLTAFKTYEKFDARGSERNWLIGILRHKITDHFRRANREIAVGENLEESSEHRSVLQGADQWKGFRDDLPKPFKKILQKEPPNLPESLMTLLLPTELSEPIIGDLHYEFVKLNLKYGRRSATVWYYAASIRAVFQVLALSTTFRTTKVLMEDVLKKYQRPS